MAASLALLAGPAHAAPFGYPEFLGATSATFAEGVHGSYDPMPSSPRGMIILVAAEGGLPAGLSINATTGVVSGAPEVGAAGRYDINLIATDDNGRESDRFAATILVAGVPALSGATTATFVEGAAASYDPTLRAGFPADATVAITGGTLPAGMTMDAASGAITGTPAYGTAGSYPVTLVASNSTGASEPLTVTIMVEHAPAPASFVLRSTSTVLSGQSFTVSGDGLVPGSTVVIELRSTPVTLGTVTADAAGAFSLLVTGLPEGIPAGAHSLVATATTPGGETTTASLAVTVPARLASTGAESGWLIATATLLLTAGGTLLLSRRRRSTA